MLIVLCHKSNCYEVGDSTQKECQKKFPFDFANKTHVDENSFPVYRRRDPANGGETFVNKRGVVVDNRWTVPYNKTILELWGGHANVILVTSVVSVKYVFKYQHKGPDRVLMKLADCNNSEIEQFVNGRLYCLEHQGTPIVQLLPQVFGVL